MATTTSSPAPDPPGAKHEHGEAPQQPPAPAAADEAPTAAIATTTPLPPSNTKHVPKARKIKTKHMDPLVLGIRRQIQQCCARNDCATALRMYRQALAEDIRVEAASFYSLLNLCDGLDHKRVHVGTPKPSSNNGASDKGADPTKKQEETTQPSTTTDDTNTTPATNNNNNNSAVISEVDLETRKQAAFDIKKRMDELQIPLNETAYTALVKILTRANELQAADAILKEAEGVQQCRVKLRLYAPLLQAYCQQGKLRQALQLWERLAHQNNTTKSNQSQPHQEQLQLSEREYAAIIECCAVHATVGNAEVVQKVFTDLSEEVLVPSRETCGILVQWFESPSAQFVEGNASQSSLLTDIQLPSSQLVGEDAPIGPVTCPSPCHKWTISEACRVDPQTGTLLEGCLQGEILQPIQLSPAAWQEMLTMNETIVLSGKLDQDTSAFQGGRKGKKRKLGSTDQELRANHWTRFQSFLDHNKNDSDQQKFDVIIDGANVGYFQQNFTGAPRHVDYRQIDSVVQHFVRLGKKVLLVMHQRHFTHHQMPQRFRPILHHWNQEGILFQTPAGMNDDWFWMHAALVLGPGTLVLTNDEMRDHHFQMLSPRSFLRWKDRHQVHFSFGGNGAPPTNGGNYNGSGGSGYRPVVLTYPEIYSRRIQRVADGYAIPHPKRGDVNRFLDGTHEADEDAPVEETYLCIRPVMVSTDTETKGEGSKLS